MTDQPMPVGTGGDGSLAVYYNGSCPVCRSEIEHYRRQEVGGTAIHWLDIAAEPAAHRRLGLDEDAGYRRLHVRDENGRLLAGLDAFLAIWEALPRYRWLANIVRRPVLRRLAEPLYERVAAPALYAMHRRRQRRSKQVV